MQYDSIKELIEANRERVNFGTFGQGVSDDWLAKAQSRLGTIFPPSFTWWLKNYRSGEIDGDEIFSIYELDFDEVVAGDIVYVNELNRKNGFSRPNQLVIQSTDAGEDYFFDLDQRDVDGECPVYSSPSNKIYASNFLDFLKRRITDVGS